MRPIILTLCSLLAAGLPAAANIAEPLTGTSTAKLYDKPGFYEKDGEYYAVGEAVHVVASRDKAEKLALKDAVDRALKALEKKNEGKKRAIDKGTENGQLLETQLNELKLGKARIQSVVQERWQAPEGKDAWDVRVMISIRRK